MRDENGGKQHEEQRDGESGNVVGDKSNLRRSLGHVDEAGGEEYEYPHASALDRGVVAEDEGFDQDV